MCISIKKEHMCEFVYPISLNVMGLILDSCLGQEIVLDNLSLSDNGEGTVIMVIVENLQNNFGYNSSSLKVEIFTVL